MLNRSLFDNDIAIDAILPDVVVPPKGEIRTALTARIVTDKILDNPTLSDFFASNPDILEGEFERSGIGGGVCVAALKVPMIKKSVSVLAKLRGGHGITGPDGVPIDLICLLLYPASEGPHYLRRLSRLTRMLCNRDLCAKIKETQDSETIRSLTHSPEGWMLAA
jgi:mannitol/fructose-specific phosphotransferase system IIA component (Ntr-type)